MAHDLADESESPGFLFCTLNRWNLASYRAAVARSLALAPSRSRFPLWVKTLVLLYASSATRQPWIELQSHGDKVEHVGWMWNVPASRTHSFLSVLLSPLVVACCYHLSLCLEARTNAGC